MLMYLARVGAVMAVCSSFAAPAVASDQSSSPDAVSELVVVTAEKRDQALEKTPLAVTAFTALDRDNLGIQGIQDYVNFTPGLNYTNLDRLSIRGSSRLTYLGGNDPGVAQYTDGFYSARSSELFKTPLFVNQVEVLRGPQGTLWGRNSIGGAITVTSPHPTQTFQGEVRAEVGDYDESRVEGYVSGPLNDAVRVRVGASRGQELTGYLHNEGSGGNAAAKGETFYEAQVEADLTPKVQAWIKYQKADWADSYGIGDRLTNTVTAYDTANFFSNASQLVPNATYHYTTANPGVTDAYAINTNSPTRGSLHGNNLIVAHLNWDADVVDIKYIGGYQGYQFDVKSDLDNTNRTGSYRSPLTGTAIYPQYTLNFKESGQYFSNEIDFNSKLGNPFQWLFGLYQYHEVSSQETHEAAPNQAEIAQPYNFYGTADAANPSRDFAYYLTKITSDSYAGFAQVDYQVIQQVKLTGGARYTEDRKSGHERVRFVLFDPDMFLSRYNDRAYDLVNGQKSYSGVWRGLTANAAVEWTPTSHDMVYARYGRGYKSGGFLLGTLASHAEAAPEYVDAYEFGYKGTINKQIVFNAAAFYNNYTGLQVNLSQFNSAHQTTENDFVNLNARAYGLELESVWRPIRPLKLVVNYNYLNTAVTQGCVTSSGAYCFADPQDPSATDRYAKVAAGVAPVSGRTSLPLPYSIYKAQTLKGDSLPQSPANKVAFDGAYTFDFTPGALTLSTAYVWQDKQTSSVFNSSAYRYGAYAVTDFRAVWRDAAKRYTAILFVKNAFDVVGYSYSQPAAILNASGVRTGYSISHGLIAPRTLGMELQYRF